MAENRWLSVFAQKPICQALAVHLSIKDWFQLTGVCTYMRHAWITRDCVAAIDMRALVEQRFGWTYAKGNPFKFVRAHMLNARMPLEVGGVAPKHFRCTGGCGKANVGKTRLMSRKLTKYAICDACFVGKGGYNTTSDLRMHIADKLAPEYVSWSNAAYVHLGEMTVILSSDIDQAVEFLSTLRKFRHSSITKRNYQWTNPKSLCLNAREYGFGPSVVKRADIERRAREEIVSFGLESMFAEWLPTVSSSSSKKRARMDSDD